MGLFDNIFGTPKPTPVTRSEVAEIGKTFEFSRTWQCSKCPAQLKIRARKDRSEGSANFMPYPPWHPQAGHSQLPSGLLTWNGLAEERGWSVQAAVVCPACKLGLSVPEYRRLRRENKIA